MKLRQFGVTNFTSLLMMVSCDWWFTF